MNSAPIQPRRDWHLNHDGARNCAKHETGGYREHVQNDYPLEGEGIGRRGGKISGCNAAEERLQQEREGDPCHCQGRCGCESVSSRQRPGGDWPVTLDRMEPVPPCIHDIVEEVTGGADSREQDEGESGLSYQRGHPVNVGEGPRLIERKEERHIQQEVLRPLPRTRSLDEPSQAV